MKHANALAAKVAAVNRANAEAKRLYPILVATFVPFYGQKVINVGGELLGIVKKALPLMPGWCDSKNTYSLSFVFKASENYIGCNGDQSVYHEVTIYVCDLDGQNAKAPTGGGDWILTARTDYAEQEIFSLREACKMRKEEARQAESALHPFGESDR